MAEYIEREAAIRAADHAYGSWNLAMATAEGNREINRVYKMQELCKAVRSVFAGMPAADVAPVVHGHWKLSELPYTQGAYVCSECNRIAAESVAGVKPLPPEMFGRQIYQYCPYCGAKMD